MVFIASLSVLIMVPDSDGISVCFDVLLCRNFLFPRAFTRMAIMKYALLLERFQCQEFETSCSQRGQLNNGVCSLAIFIKKRSYFYTLFGKFKLDNAENNINYKE
jgi:hypothetical protein